VLAKKVNVLYTKANAGVLSRSRRSFHVSAMPKVFRSRHPENIHLRKPKYAQPRPVATALSSAVGGMRVRWSAPSRSARVAANVAKCRVQQQRICRVARVVCSAACGKRQEYREEVGGCGGRLRRPRQRAIRLSRAAVRVRLLTSKMQTVQEGRNCGRAVARPMVPVTSRVTRENRHYRGRGLTASQQEMARRRMF